MTDTKYAEDAMSMFKKSKEVGKKYLEKFVTDGDKNFAEFYRSQYMASGTTHTGISILMATKIITVWTNIGCNFSFSIYVGCIF